MKAMESEKLYCAIHEAGHAVAGSLAGYSLDYVTVLPTPRSAKGEVHYHNKGTRLPDDAPREVIAEGLRRMLRVDVAGAVAEYLAYRDDPKVPPLSYWREVEEDGKLTDALTVEVFKIHSRMRDSFAQEPEFFEQEYGAERLIPPTLELLAEHWSAVRKIAFALMLSGRISGARVSAIIEKAKKGELK